MCAGANCVWIFFYRTYTPRLACSIGSLTKKTVNFTQQKNLPHSPLRASILSAKKEKVREKIEEKKKYESKHITNKAVNKIFSHLLVAKVGKSWNCLETRFYHSDPIKIIFSNLNLTSLPLVWLTFTIYVPILFMLRASCPRAFYILLLYPSTSMS